METWFLLLQKCIGCNQNASGCNATCQTIFQLDLWFNVCHYNLVCILLNLYPFFPDSHTRFSPFYHGGVLQSTPLPALASQYTICWLYLNVCIQIANKLGNLKKKCILVLLLLSCNERRVIDSIQYRERERERESVCVRACVRARARARNSLLE
jgi:hypothetical protein